MTINTLLKALDIQTKVTITIDKEIEIDNIKVKDLKKLSKFTSNLYIDKVVFKYVDYINYCYITITI